MQPIFAGNPQNQEGCSARLLLAPPDTAAQPLAGFYIVRLMSKPANEHQASLKQYLYIGLSHYLWLFQP